MKYEGTCASCGQSFARDLLSPHIPGDPADLATEDYMLLSNVEKALCQKCELVFREKLATSQRVRTECWCQSIDEFCTTRSLEVRPFEEVSSRARSE